MGRMEAGGRREYRRKRRIRNQILAWLSLVIIVALIAFGVYMLIKKLPLKKTGAGEGEASTVSEVEQEGDTGNDLPQTIESPDEMIEVDTEEEGGEEGTQEAGEGEDGQMPAVEEVFAPEILDSIAELSLEQKIDGLFIVSPEAITNVDIATVAGNGTRTALEEYAVGGILYAAKNVLGKDQFQAMVSTTQGMYGEIYGRHLLMFVQEDGTNNTIAGAATGVSSVAAASELGSSGNRENAEAAYETMGTYLRDYGIDADLAPVAGVLADNGYLGNRCFSDDADIVSSMVGAATDGLKNAGVIPCLYAFPGEGRLSSDPNGNAASVGAELAELTEADLKPFASAVSGGIPAIVVSNEVVDALGSEGASACLSQEVITSFLRGNFGYTGVVITAPLDQKANTSSADMGEAAVNALEAGADMMIIRSYNGYTAARDAIMEAVSSGRISEEAVDKALARIYTMKSAFGLL